MAIVLRCNVLQLAPPEPGLRLPESEIALRFDECKKVMSTMMNGDIELTIATGPLRLTIPGYRTPGASDIAALTRRIAHMPQFVALRGSAGFGPIHVCYIDAFLPDRDQNRGGLSHTQGCTEYPFLFTTEYVHERIGFGGSPRWITLLHEFGHALLARSHRDHVEVAGNLMCPDERAGPNVTPEQRDRMRRTATRIAAGKRPDPWP
jgi:hypothetical protein